MKLPFPVSVEPKTRFPVVGVPGTNYALAWLPMTKLQIEYYLCETMDSQFDRNWYQACLQRSPRVSMEELNADTVRQAFIGNLLFHEARRLSREWGRYFDLPTLEEWRTALLAFDQVEAQDDFVAEVLALPALHPRARLLLHRVEAIVKSESRSQTIGARPFSHQLLMRSGILEYTYADESRNACVACGSPRRFSARERTFEEGFVTRLLRADIGERRPNLGFRLIVRRSE